MRYTLVFLALMLAVADVSAASRSNSKSSSQSSGSQKSGGFGLGKSVGDTVSTRNIGRAYDKAAEATSRAFSHTAESARGLTRSVEGATDPNSGSSGTFSLSGPRGNTRSGSFSGSTTVNPDGSITRNQEVTAENGNTATRSVTSTVNTEEGTVERSVTSPTGNTREVQSSWNRGNVGGNSITYSIDPATGRIVRHVQR